MFAPDQLRITNEQPTSHVEDAPVINHRHLQFLPKAGSPRVYTVRHQMDVGVLSHRMMFLPVRFRAQTGQSVSVSLQNGICLFHPPKSARL